MSVNWGLSPLQYMQETAQTPMQLQMSWKDRFRTSMQEAMLYNPARLLMERKALEEVSAPITQMSYTPQELREMYADTIGNTTPWAKYLNGEGKVNQQVVDRLLHRYMATSANAQLMQDGYANFSQGSASLLGAVAGSFRDPINVAIGMIPVYGLEAAVGKAVVGTSPNILRAFGARFLSGAAEDMLINGTFATPYAMSIRSDLGDSPTVQEYFQSVAVGGLIGGGLRGFTGLVTDPTGRRLTTLSTAYRTDTENRISNMTPAELDAVGVYVAQADARGVDVDVDTLLEMSSAFQKSTVSAEARNLAELSLAYKAGLTEEPEVTIRRVKGNVVAETTVNGIKYSAKSSTDAAALAMLQRRVLHSINNRILPKITERSDGTFTAQYTRDKGPAKELVGYGRTEAEAVRALHRLYSDAMSPSKKTRQSMRKEKAATEVTARQLATLEKDMAEQTVSAYGRGGGQIKDMAKQVAAYRKQHLKAQAELEAKYREDYATAKTPAEKAKLTRSYNKQKKELEEALQRNIQSIQENATLLAQDAYIRGANASNVDLGVFEDTPLVTEAEFGAKANALMTHTNEKMVEYISQTEQTARDARAATKNLADREKYAMSIAERIRASESFNALPTEIKDRIVGLTNAKKDVDIFNSKEMDDIIQSFNACERGL